LITDDSYFVIVDYDEDTERKRAEYLLNNWDDGIVTSPHGLTRRVENADIDELYAALAAKVPEEQISAFEIRQVSGSVEITDATLELHVDTPLERVEWAIESVLNKRKAVDETDEKNTYAVYSKKGRAKISYDIYSHGDDTVLSVTIEGYGSAPEFLREYFEEELSYML
jgi:hypothetical protein